MIEITAKSFPKFAHIPDAQLHQDVADTQKEIDDYQDEKDVLMRNPRDNKVRIYLLEGRVLHREGFIKKLNAILSFREG